MILELTADSENLTAFDIQAYFNSHTSKSFVAPLSSQLPLGLAQIARVVRPLQTRQS